MLNQNQNISTPVQHQNHSNHGTDMGMNGNYVQQQRQQQSQMSGTYQRPSNGSNILEQHAMRPATTADPSNCVFNDQEPSINGTLRNDSLQMQQQNMMGMQSNPMQKSQMVSNNMATTGNNQIRLPSLTLSSNNFSSNGRNQQKCSTVHNCQNTQNVQNGYQNQVQNQVQNPNQQSFQQNMIHVQNAQQPQQMSQRSYDQSICQNKVPSMTMKDQQLFSGQQSMNSQQMVPPPRMNTPVLTTPPHLQKQGVQNMQQSVQQSSMQQSSMHSGNMQQNQIAQQIPQNQKQNRVQSGRQPQQNQRSNAQRQNVQQQVQQKPQQMQQQQNTQQQSCSQMMQQPIIQQQSGMQSQNFQQQNVHQNSCQQQQPQMQQSTMQQQNFQQQPMVQQQNCQSMQNQQPMQQNVYQQNVQTSQNMQDQQTHNQMNQQAGLIQQRSNSQLSMGPPQVQNGNRTVSSFQNNPPSGQMSHLSHMDPPPTQHSLNSVPQPQMQQQSNQMSANSAQMMSVPTQVQSPTNVSTSNSPTRLPSLAYGNSNTQPINHSNIPMNANPTTQLLMALNTNSPISAEQLNEIQKMTCIAPDGTEILLMQEPRLKQYGAIKEMSTQDLRMECKKRALPSTGTKVRLSERLIQFEAEVLDERNNQLMMEYTHRQQMYEAQAATLKAFQAKKASLQVQSNEGQRSGGPVVSSNEISSTTQSMPTLTQQTEGPPPPKKKRPTKSKKSQQQQEKLKVQLNTSSNGDQVVNSMGNEGIMNMIPNTLIGNIGNNSIGNMSNQGSQNSATNIFGNVNQPASGFFMKDNTCFSHLGSGCTLISTVNSEDGQNSSFNGSARPFPLTVPPPPEDNQLQFQPLDPQNFGNTNQISQQQMNTQSRPISLNQQQALTSNNVPNNVSVTTPLCDSINSHISNMFNPSSISNGQQVQQQQTQIQPQQQNQQNYMNPVPQNGLQASPCEADQAGSSPNVPVNDTSATTSTSSPVLVSSVSDNSFTSEMMDIETMQQLLSPETLRAREELLTQQQTKINELVTLIQKHHDTLREQQQQINLAKRQQKIRQRQNTQPACAIDKQVNSRSLQHAIKSRQNFQALNELTKQQDSIRTAETRLIEQLHINTATDDIARLIKQDGRTALVIVSLLHHYRTTREQNNQPKSTDDTPVTDKTSEGGKKKAPARKRNNNGKMSSQSKKNSVQSQPDIEVVQVISSEQARESQNSQLDFSDLHTPQESTSDINMDAIFEIVINPSDNGKNKKSTDNQTNQPQFDNEVVSLPSEGSSPNQMQTLNSMQSGFSDGFNSKSIVYQDNSPQENSFMANVDNGSSSTYSPDTMYSSQNEAVHQNFQITQQREVMDVLPQLEQHSIEQELGNHQFSDQMHFSDDSNQGFFDQNCQNNFDESVMYSETAFDQLVADFQTNPPNCEVDGDLNKILNSLDNYGTDESNKNMGQEANELCDLFYQHNSLDLGQFQSFDWNEFNAQSNIINQAFEQSEMH